MMADPEPTITEPMIAEPTTAELVADVAIRRTVRYAGRVQGVGFRYTTRETAAGFRVTGYVQNLDDGRVLMVAEGRRSEVERFCAALAAAMERNIRSIDTDESCGDPQFTDFTIRV
jgi:acylphosphatase